MKLRQSGFFFTNAQIISKRFNWFIAFSVNFLLLLLMMLMIKSLVVYCCCSPIFFYLLYLFCVFLLRWICFVLDLSVAQFLCVKRKNLTTNMANFKLFSITQIHTIHFSIRLFYISPVI